jgi:tripartite-type tricarboxylate transporter receptor subunit TctC
MQIQRRLKLCALLSSCLLFSFPALTSAQGTNYPTRPITFVVPNAAGGAADNLARSFAEELSRKIGQPIVVENLGGAS